MPKLYRDSLLNSYYTIVNLPAHNGELDTIVFRIKYRGAEWLLYQGAAVGHYLPDGIFPILYFRNFLYPNKGLSPSGVEVSTGDVHPDAKRPKLRRDKDGTAYFTGLRLRRSDGETDRMVCLIGTNGVRWLQKRKVQIGQDLPDGAFRTLFERGWIYPE